MRIEGTTDRVAALEEQVKKIQEDMLKSSYMMMALLQNVNTLIDMYQRQSTRPICILQYLEASSPPCQMLKTVPTMQVATKLGSRKKQELIQQKKVPAKMKRHATFRLIWYSVVAGEGASTAPVYNQPESVTIPR